MSDAQGTITTTNLSERGPPGPHGHDTLDAGEGARAPTDRSRRAMADLEVRAPKGGTACTYDVANHLTGFGSEFTAGYRGDGLRAWQQSGTTRKYYLYDGWRPVCELDAAGTVLRSWTFGPDGLVPTATLVFGLLAQYRFYKQCLETATDAPRRAILSPWS